MTGYEAMRQVAYQSPEVLRTAKAAFDYGVEPFRRKSVDPESPGRLDRLVVHGVLERVGVAGADANGEYRFVDREGAGRALRELEAAGALKHSRPGSQDLGPTKA
jgi:hypothetical protein